MKDTEVKAIDLAIFSGGKTTGSRYRSMRLKVLTHNAMIWRRRQFGLRPSRKKVLFRRNKNELASW
jgi:hypothetical protein